MSDTTIWEQWEQYLERPDTKQYLADNLEGRRGWIPRWMVNDFLRELTKDSR